MLGVVGVVGSEEVRSNLGGSDVRVGRAEVAPVDVVTVGGEPAGGAGQVGRDPADDLGGHLVVERVDALVTVAPRAQA
jgi:hypothetical protein